MPHYQHLTEAERYQIFILLKAGFSHKAIALQLHRHRSTIHRELKRNLVTDSRVPVTHPHAPTTKLGIAGALNPTLRLGAILG